ncbi:MAG TPA: type II toxin-antitoxin system HicA family toxin [Devosia sp.]
MVRGFYAEIVKELKAAGCTLVRSGRGDHEVWFSPRTNRNLTVDRGSLSRHTANAVMKQAGIKRHF